jgi:hypothetical protein
VVWRNDSRRCRISARRDPHTFGFSPCGARGSRVGVFRALDDAAFFAANSLVNDAFVLTVSFSIHFVRPVSTGVLHARGRVVHGGRRLFTAESHLFDDSGTLLGQGTGVFTKSAIALEPSVGYE